MELWMFVLRNEIPSPNMITFNLTYFSTPLLWFYVLMQGFSIDGPPQIFTFFIS